MSEGTLASAVAVPEQETLQQSPEFPTKRRQSSVSENESKRRRLSAQNDESPQSQRRRPSSPTASQRPTERRPARPGREEDRKRGQRLFGALLGTLSQSSGSAAQKRRADIEKRQQDKLKVQDEAYDELKKQRRERRDAIRRKEKPFYEREAMRTRHANLVAMAHFLKTKTEPSLYYKPWQSRQGDEEIIRAQIEDAEATVAREVAEFEARYPPEAFVRQDLEPAPRKDQPEDTKPKEPQQPESQPEQGPSTEPEANSKEPQEMEAAPTVDAQPKQQQQSSAPAQADESEPAPEPETHTSGREQADVHHDDGGEVVEDNEDTVIY